MATTAEKDGTAHDASEIEVDKKPEFVVEVEGDDGTTEVVADGAKRDAANVSDPDEGVEALKAQLARAKESETAALARAAAADTARASEGSELAKQRVATITAHETAAKQAIEASTSALAAAKAKYKAARETDNFDDEAEALSEMTAATNRLESAKGYDARVQAAKKSIEDAPADQNNGKAAGPVMVNGVDVSGLTPGTQDWFRRNAGKFEYSNVENKVKAAHFMALSAGHAQDSPGYFAELDKAIGAPAQNGNGNGASQGNGSGKINTAGTGASPSRGSSNGGGRITRVVLTREEAQAAKDMDMSPAEYAQGLVDDKKSRLYTQRAQP